jgi:hypothetical protein
MILRIKGFTEMMSNYPVNPKIGDIVVQMFFNPLGNEY